MFLEAEPNLRVDATIVSSGCVAKTSKAARSSSRLSKQSRSEVTHRIIKIRVVQQILEVQRERQVVATTASAAATKPAWTTRTTKTTASRRTAAWPTRSSATSHAAAHHCRTLSIVLTILTILLIRV